MNKRILKLFNEAGFHQPEMERLGIEDKFEKFAELIIQECSLTVQDFVDHRIPASEYPDRLKHHFGVEE